MTMPNIPVYKFKLWGVFYRSTSLAALSAMFSEQRDASGLGASEMPSDPIIHDQSGNAIGRLSYNGKIWPIAEWTPDQAAIFDPYVMHAALASIAEESGK